MTLKKSYPTKLTNRQFEDQQKRGKVKYRKEKQRQSEAEDEIKAWLVKGQDADSEV